MVDFAYHVHTDVGNQMFGAKVNGKAVHAGHALANAEVVEVLTYDGRPSKGSIARHQVRYSMHGGLPVVATVVTSLSHEPCLAVALVEHSLLPWRGQHPAFCRACFLNRTPSPYNRGSALWCNAGVVCFCPDQDGPAQADKVLEGPWPFA